MVVKKAVIEKIRKHFDESLTPRGTDFSYIINEIPHAIREDDLDTFFSEVTSIFQEVDSFYPFFLSSEAVYLDFWNSMFDVDNVVSDKLIKYLQDPVHEVVFLPLLHKFPNRVNLLKNNPSYIRNLWYEKLPERASRYRIFGALLRNALIPKEQLEEAMIRIISRNCSAVPNEEEHYILNENGFFKMLKTRVFEDPRLLGNFEWANNNTEIFIYYLEKFGLDENIVSCISSQFNSSIHPFTLRDALKNYFYKNSALKERFESIAAEHNIILPERLGFSI
ncbi:hypothetical protein ACT7CX_19850 [Bacillus cereus]